MLALSLGAAGAADRLPLKTKPKDAPFSWAGAYIGGTVGYSIGPVRASLQWQYFSKLDLPAPSTLVGWPSYSLFNLSGSYELTDGSFVTHPVVSKNPATMGRGSFTAYAFRVSGDTLWLTPQRDARGAVPNPPTIKLRRVE